MLLPVRGDTGGLFLGNTCGLLAGAEGAGLGLTSGFVLDSFLPAHGNPHPKPPLFFFLPEELWPWSVRSTAVAAPCVLSMGHACDCGEAAAAWWTWPESEWWLWPCCCP